MRWALLSDIHGNKQALEACLDHAATQNIDSYAFLGDLVGYGADPGAVVDRVMAMTEQGALALRGNHDEMAVHPPQESQTLGESTALWTHHQLNSVQCDFLENLPLTLQADRMLLVHATADAPQQWRYVYEPEIAAISLDAASEIEGVRYVFGGHVHRQALYFRGADDAMMPFVPTVGVPIPVSPRRYWLATIGSVGQPRDGNPKAMYTVFDDQAHRLVFHRVDYDVHAAACAIRDAGLASFFADRLEVGR
jgi:diadenosine tetraphosphatase ApaH/serine/threonine PP2A family protein phosphatase